MTLDNTLLWFCLSRWKPPFRTINAGTMLRNLFKNGVPIQVKASLAVLTAQLCFSGWHIVGSLAFKQGANPLVFLMYRLLFGTALMHLYIKYYKLGTHIDESDYRRLVVCGMLSFLNVFSGSIALTLIAPSRFAIFQPTIPCIVTTISMLFRLEEIHYVKLLGIAFAVAGAFVAELWKMGGDSDSAEEKNIPLGVFLAIVNVSAMAVLQIVVKPLLNKYDSAVVSGMYFLISTGAILTVIVCRIDAIPMSDFAFDSKLLPWLAVGYVAVFATMYAFSAINWGGKRLPPTVTTVFFTFQPVGTIILSATLLGAVVTIPELLGGFLIILGLVVTSFAQSKVQPVRVPSDKEIEDEGLETVPHINGAFVELKSNSSSFNPMQSQGGSYLQLDEEHAEVCNTQDATEDGIVHVENSAGGIYIYDQDVESLSSSPPVMYEECPSIDLLDL